ncbi:MAG: tetratricopeptide repeat protein, partial [Nitrososphaera sp.]|nr:tetratricopeptide repeat protein [Nitrososphaera sp.]
MKVGSVLEGSVRKSENAVRITVQLIDTQSQVLLWSQDYDRELKDVFAIQSDIAEQVAEALKLQLVTEEALQIEKKGTENLEAYPLYLKGRYYLNKRTLEGIKKGIEHFEQAIEKDPNYALAYAGLADSYNLLAAYGFLPPKEAYPRARAAAEKALEINDTLAEAQTSLAFVKHRFDWDWSGAEEAFEQALDLNPSYATTHHWYAFYLIQMGRIEESFAEIKRAQELDPLSLIINTDVGRVFYYARQYDRTIEECQKTLEIDPDFVRAHLDLGLAYEQKAMYEEAIQALQKVVNLTGGSLLPTALLGHAYGISGKLSEAQKILELLKEKSQQNYVPPGY